MEQMEVMSCSLYKTCLLCKELKERKEFINLIRSGKKVKVRNYCNDCREKHTIKEIEYLMNQIFSPKKTSCSQSIAQHVGFLTGKEILVIGFRNRWKEIHPIEYAQRIVNEGLAEIIGSTAVKVLFDKKSLKEFVLYRDNHFCALCGNPASLVKRIIPKENGGLKTPENLQAVCENCLSISEKKIIEGTKLLKLENLSIQYAIPIYINVASKVYSAIENPEETILKCVSDPNNTHYFCDISEHPSRNGVFGIAVVEAGRGRILVHAKTVKWLTGKSSQMERNAVHWALKLGQKSKVQNFAIYTDTDVLQIKDEYTKRLLPPNANIHFLSNEEQRHTLYRMAHRFSRKAAREVNCPS
ncbi:hypothetical protein EEL31_09025 [Brevibacillus laterosporus]|nr:hypothetical protein [Brevibacillus laterosporus]TPG68650.1 hypothetical protein EEL31_09025 [Brevibacillus laterosporus]